MKTFSSLAAVMVLWLAVSFSIWLVYRIFRRSDGSKQKRLLSSAIGLIDEGASIFAALRTRASTRVTAQGNYQVDPGRPGETIREDVRSLLNSIEAQSAYFDRVNTAKKKVQKTFDMPDFLALSEILQIRRDFWAASEIFLMEGIRELGPELADAEAFETFEAEARALLFKDEAAAAAPGSRDPVELRLAIAREDALAFQAQTESEIASALERSRFPTPAELIAVPWSLVRCLAAGLREVRYLLGDAVVTARSLARAVSSKGLKGAAEELRQVRAGMPGHFATAFERAGGLARQGGDSLKRHYEFVLEAQELRARYAELLARAPALSEKGKQFLARLELERRAEQFRETSGDLSDWARQKLVAGIAYLIAGLQYVQAKITPAANKQLAPLPAGAGAASAPEPAPAEPEQPLRVLLLPSSAYSGGNYGQALGTAERRRRRQDAAPEAMPGERIERLRDLVTGEEAPAQEDRPAKLASKKRSRREAKPRFPYADGLKKTSFKDLLAESVEEPEEAVEAADRPGRPRSGGGSLLDRLSSLEREAQAPAPADSAEGEVQSAGGPIGAQPKPKGWRLFGSTRK